MDGPAVLTLEQKKRIFYEVAEAQDQVRIESYRRFGDDKVADLRQKTQWENEQDVVCIQNVCKKYGISEDQYYKVHLEGASDKWPLPPIS